MLPVYEALIEDFDSGIYKISLVDEPAVESDFLYFNKKNTPLKFTVANEEQRMVTGVIMRADFLIYRYDEKYGEYYIKYSKDTIKKMSEKMMIDKTFNNINLMHEDGTDVDGVNLVEIFIKDTSKGISPVGFDDIEDGSLFATYKINNEAIWEQIKNGTFKAFSIEGLFDIEKQQFSKQKNKNKSIMSKMITKLFNKFLKSFVKCGSVETDKGTLYWVGEADLQIGDELFYNSEDEEAIKVEDGEYKLNDGTTITVKDGLVSEIKKADGEQEGELDMEEEEKEKEEKEVEAEEESTEDESKAEIDALKAEIESLKAEIEKIKEVLNQPAAAPIEEEFERITKKTDGIVPAFGSRAKRFS